MADPVPKGFGVVLKFKYEGFSFSSSSQPHHCLLFPSCLLQSVMLPVCLEVGMSESRGPPSKD